MASYVYSRLEGNYDGEYAPFTNIGADPNISAAYDYYEFFTNGTDLTKITKQRSAFKTIAANQFKASGIYNTPWKLSLGVLGLLAQRHACNPLRLLVAYKRYEFFLTSRGAKGARRAITTPTSTSATQCLRTLPSNILLDVLQHPQHATGSAPRRALRFQERGQRAAKICQRHLSQTVVRTRPTSARLGVR